MPSKNGLRDIIVFIVFVLLIIWAVRLSNEAQYNASEMHDRIKLQPVR